MPVPISKSECCGCSLCAEVCPVKCITMTSDDEGFRYPMVTESSCIHCEKCVKLCPFASKKNLKNTVCESVVCQHEVAEELMKSRSGAAFAICSDWVLQNGGAIYGAVLTPEMVVVHTRAVNSEERDKMRGSKYVQSNIEGLYSSILSDAEKGLVLFSGTACQVDAVKQYFKMAQGNSRNLYTIDLICHGVASPQIFADFIAFAGGKRGKVEKFVFRDKKFGWDSHIATYIIGNMSCQSTLYRNLYNENIVIRPSCHNCHYASLDRAADLTIADAWNVQNVYPSFDYKQGVSLCMANTEKGVQLLEIIKEKSIWETAAIEDFMQNNMRKPTPPGKDRDAFWRDYKKKGFRYVLHKYAQKSIWVRLLNAARYYTKRACKIYGK